MDARKVTKNGKEAWVVDIGKRQAGDRIRIYRSSKAAAIQAARERINDAALGDEALTLDERAFVLRWRGKLGGWDAITRILEPMERATAITVESAVSKYLKAPRDRQLSKRHIDNLGYRLGAFAREFHGKSLSSLTPGRIHEYITAQGASAANHYRPIRALFNYAILQDWLAVNPLGRIPKPSARAAEKDLLTPAQMVKALRICAGVEPGCVKDTSGELLTVRHESLLRSLIVGGLCGLRQSEAYRLDCADINVELGEIHVRKMKTAHSGMAERHVVVPPNALEWLRWLQLPKYRGPQKFITHNEQSIRYPRNTLVETLGLSEWPHNALRRSFGSYHLAAFQNAAVTAELMGHTDARTTKAKYRVPRRREVGVEWFAITPEILSAPAPANSQES